MSKISSTRRMNKMMESTGKRTSKLRVLTTSSWVGAAQGQTLTYHQGVKFRKSPNSQ